MLSTLLFTTEHQPEPKPEALTPILSVTTNTNGRMLVANSQLDGCIFSSHFSFFPLLSLSLSLSLSLYHCILNSPFSPKRTNPSGMWLVVN